MTVLFTNYNKYWILKPLYDISIIINSKFRDYQFVLMLQTEHLAEDIIYDIKGILEKQGSGIYCCAIFKVIFTTDHGYVENCFCPENLFLGLTHPKDVILLSLMYDFENIKK